jgi:hypothetical protein
MDAALTVPQRGATGPRTAAGKRRSRMNAIKHGFFSKHLLLEGEDPAEYEKLHRDLRDDWQPIGRSMDLEVERLASIYWHLRRGLTAGAAHISRSPGFVGTGERTDLPNQDLLRVSLEDDSTPVNPKVAFLRCAARKLCELSEDLSSRGFDFQEDTAKLCNIYRNFLDDSALMPYEEIMKLLRRSRERETQECKSADAEDLVSEAIEAIHAEIMRFVKLICKEQERHVMYTSLTSLIPAQADLDRIIGYDSHLSREIDRSISRLERMQRAQRSRSSSIRVDLES